ncbi:glycosyl hydrolase [Paenibacillus sp. 79R4]|nr:glycoside hydrolase family 30 protein [Paenibacillus sp. GM2]NWL87116.1 glycosyl hydrolase [Paenibacillus sp. 79R4]
MMSYPVEWYSTSTQEAWAEKKSFSYTEESANLSLNGELHQLVEGFGGCFNELGYIALQHLSEEQRHEIFYSLFHPDGDHKFTICRLPIGASDYAEKWYSHNETDGDLEMKYFSIERDFKYLIPYIKEAQSYNPDLKFFASPWSPPTWMKYPKAYNYGTLRWEKEILEAYALYFVKFVQAYEEQGIPIHQIHVQNEVIADQKFPSCVWTGEQLREFIADYLGPAFEQYGLNTEIWLGTINAPDPWEELLKKRTTDFDDYAGIVLSDPKAYSYIKGVGYQWAGKNAIKRTVDSYPELRYMQTENECGDGENSWDYARYVYNLYQHYFSHGVNAYIYWNMVLEPRGRSTWGWEQNSMITVDPQTKQYTFNPEYYVMKHFAYFIAPGSRRIGLQGAWTGKSVAFCNPDGEIVVVINNPFKEARRLNLNAGDQTLSFELEAGSFNTIVIKK